MKVSLSTVKQFINFELPSIDELVARINAQLGGVEETIDLSAKYKDVKIVKVVECEKHPDADKLSVCMVDDGSGELVQVVCGAPNVHAGMWAAWLPPESVVPATYDDAEPFVLGARELRGVMSNGMLASAKELGIGDNHEGIVEITESDVLQGPSLQGSGLVAGASFAAIFGLNDYVIDIENKMFTHRPDLFGQIGVAREIAGIFGKQFEEKDWYWKLPEFADAHGLELETFNEASEKVQRLMFVAMKNIEVKPSPLWLQCALVVMGGKPINNIVDVTNYIMLLTAQPTHAYDYDKIRGHKIGVRMAKPGETLQLLNGKTYELTADDIVIADGEGAIGLGGIMGGGNSEVSRATKNIVLEVATFDMYAVRKSSMRHGIFTDALARFNKGQSPLQNDRIINLLMMCVKDVSVNAEQASSVHNNIYDGLKQAHDDQSLHGTMKVEPEFINDRLGLELSSDEMEQLLRNVRFACYVERDKNETAINFTAPFWRTDIEQAEDIVEEVGRLYGFDRLPHELPMRSTSPIPKNGVRELKRQIRDTLSGMGANEVLTYSFVHEKVLKNVGQNPEFAYKLSNALSPDLQYYRMSLMPSLLDKVAMNYRAGHEKFVVYEIGKSHFKGEMDKSEPTVPNEDTLVAGVIVYGDKQKPTGAPYYQALQYAKALLDSEVKLVPLADFDTASDEWDKQFVSAYQPNRTAVIVKDGQVWGVIGEFTPSVRRNFKLPEYTAGFELHQDIISLDQSRYVPLSRFPSITQDISLRVSNDVAYESLYQSVIAAALGAESSVNVRPISIYQPNDASTKTISFRVTCTNYDRTLHEDDASQVISAIASKAKQTVAAEQV